MIHLDNFDRLKWLMSEIPDKIQEITSALKQMFPG